MLNKTPFFYFRWNENYEINITINKLYKTLHNNVPS